MPGVARTCADSEIQHWFWLGVKEKNAKNYFSKLFYKILDFLFEIGIKGRKIPQSKLMKKKKNLISIETLPKSLNLIIQHKLKQQQHQQDKI